jgi:rSAM/selenodomain-associated transferase 1
MTTAIAVMAKAPRAGASKTRLIPRVTPDQAAELSATFLGDVTSNVALASQRSAGGITAYVAYAPASMQAAFDGILAPGTRLILADGKIKPAAGVIGFGNCLLQAIRALLDAGHTAACVLNADSPNLPTRILLAAHDALNAPGERIVLGATDDGGYYLLGMKHAHASLFADIDWSTDKVAAQTRVRASEAGLPVTELESWYDVDEPAALDRLSHDLVADTSHDGYAAPQTIACLGRIGMHMAFHHCGKAEIGATP